MLDLSKMKNAALATTVPWTSIESEACRIMPKVLTTGAGGIVGSLSSMDSYSSFKKLLVRYPSSNLSLQQPVR